MLLVRQFHVDRVMQKCFRNVLAAIPAATGLAFVGSAVAQQPAAELSRKEWWAHIERTQSRLEQLRQDGKIIEESEPRSQQSVANREAREEWLAKVDAARKRVEQLRASRETSEQEDIALKDDAPGPSEAAGDEFRVGTLPPANMVGPSSSEAGKLQRASGKPSLRDEPTKQTGPGREQKSDHRMSKQVKRSRQYTQTDPTVRDRSPARVTQVSNAVAATSSSCRSFWGCLKQAVGIR